jgi:glycosyltransferase involved in cell wall biosynthesis
VWPKVSVLISTYNRPQFLAEALASVLAQDFDDIEVIVRDDAGRPREVEDVIKSFNDDRIAYRRNTRNVRDFETNVLLYNEARGQYLAHLDDDDAWCPGFLKRMVTALDDNPDCGLAFAGSLVMDVRGNPLPERTRSSNAKWGRAGLATGRHSDGRRLAVVARAIPAGHSAVVRAETLDRERFANAKAGRAWDMYIAALSVRRTGWLWFDSEVLSFYRWGHSDQMSGTSTRDDTFEGLVWSLRELASDPYFAAERPALLCQLAKQEGLWSAHKLLREKCLAEAMQHLGRVGRASRDLVTTAFG